MFICVKYILYGLISEKLKLKYYDEKSGQIRVEEYRGILLIFIKTVALYIYSYKLKWYYGALILSSCNFFSEKFHAVKSVVLDILTFIFETHYFGKTQEILLI